MVIDSQLKWVLNLLNEHKVPYWLNSGTLLGLMREGKLLGHDQDIDISLWAAHETALKKLLPHFKKAGYTVLTADYKGLKFQYNFSLKGSPGQRTIDINLFRRCGEHAWCPEYYFKVQPGSPQERKSEISGILRSTLRHFWRKIIAQIPIKVSVSSWPWCNFIYLATWWIPAAYFDELEFREDLEAYIPVDWKDYLEFRYGDWTVPCQNWVFHQDDGGLLSGSPEQICGLIDSWER